MTKLAETYFRLGVRLEESDRGEFQSFLNDRARAYAGELFGQHPEIVVYIADGSLRSWIIIAGAMYVGIGQYGSFRSGVDYVVRDARTFSERVFEDV
jgi:hypothetical protein